MCAHWRASLAGLLGVFLAHNIVQCQSDAAGAWRSHVSVFIRVSPVSLPCFSYVLVEDWPAPGGDCSAELADTETGRDGRTRSARKLDEQRGRLVLTLSAELADTETGRDADTRPALRCSR
ncbi:hypothetical protein [Ktedonobacter racemifer]|uniref:Uncharacterized protein n=1 Tax=Ktedonobacter racemifer DSM 44963 TaxID=485913 RepID=D6U8Y4_KTERA|nr:hypothetical protein [Ktedonobacter racemifer]EFH79539.1 hypothetical protein Krac_0049 [Ktedonobacter racemifer DSM 44963]